MSYSVKRSFDTDRIPEITARLTALGNDQWAQVLDPADDPATIMLACISYVLQTTSDEGVQSLAAVANAELAARGLA